MTVDDLLCQSKTESVTLIAFRGKERPKQLLGILRRNAMPVVSDDEVQLVRPPYECGCEVFRTREGHQGH